MVEPIEDILNDLGPSLSSELAAALVERLGISSAAARQRQRLSRVRGNIRRLAGVYYRETRTSCIWRGSSDLQNIGAGSQPR